MRMNCSLFFNLCDITVAAQSLTLIALQSVAGLVDDFDHTNVRVYGTALDIGSQEYNPNEGPKNTLGATIGTP